MNIAECKIDGDIYDAEEFSRLGRKKRESKKGTLICTECEQPAYFRQKGRDGSAPRFGSRLHEEWCELATTSKDPKHTPAINPEYMIDSDIDTIVIDFNYGKQDELQPTVRPKNPIKSKKTKHKSYIEPSNKVNNQSTHRLKPLLNRLINDSTFSHSYTRLKIPELGETTVNEFFINIQNVTKKSEGKIKGLWGEIVSRTPKVESEPMWLNSSSEKGHFSFLVEFSDVKKLERKYKMHSRLLLTKGSYILMIGKVNFSANGKLYCQIDDLDKVAIKPPSRKGT